MRTIETSALIPVPPSVAWTVLTDLPGHRAWDPFLLGLDGRLEVGQRLRVRIAPPGGRPMAFRPTVTAVEPGRRLEWLGRLGVRGVFDGRHAFELVDRGDGTTRLVHRETFRGVLVPALWRSMVGPTTAGFERFNDAFARRCVELASHPVG